MLVTWVRERPAPRRSIVDVVWGPAFALVALVGALAGDGDPARRWLLFGLTAAWGLRLALHLANRKRKDPAEDRRYARLRKGRGLVRALESRLDLRPPGPAHPGRVAAASGGRQAGAGLDTTIVPGLVSISWAWCSRRWATFSSPASAPTRRHGPGDGPRPLALHPPPQLLRGRLRVVRPLADRAPGRRYLVDRHRPVVMAVLLVRVSGAVLLERSIGERRPGYAEYVRRTSAFVPLPSAQRARAARPPAAAGTPCARPRLCSRPARRRCASTRWQGTTTGIGLAPSALPAARTARGLPAPCATAA